MSQQIQLKLWEHYKSPSYGESKALAQNSVGKDWSEKTKERHKISIKDWFLLLIQKNDTNFPDKPLKYFEQSIDGEFSNH